MPMTFRDEKGTELTEDEVDSNFRTLEAAAAAASAAAAAITKSSLGLGSVDNTADLNKPVSYAQQAALNTKEDKQLTIIYDTGTDYTLPLFSGSNTYIRLDNADPIACTAPAMADVAIPVGSTCHIRQVGAGQVTVGAAAGVTILTPETLNLRKVGAIVSLTKVATDTWEIYGDLEAA